MLKRTLFALLLLVAASRAAAVDYTDIYYVLGEDGYGFNVVENDSDFGSFLFVTFFIYGTDNKPTWYTAQLTLDQNSGNFNGSLYATTGTYFGLPWNPKDHSAAVQVGAASFQPNGPYTAKFIYVVTGPPMVTVTKSIQRQFLGNFIIDGVFSGIAKTIESGCASAGTFFDDVDITVSQPINNAGPVSIVLKYINFSNSLTCTYSGNLTAWGKLYQIPSASYVCSDGFKSNAKIDELIRTPHGIEGVWSAINGDCRETGTFSGLQQ
jgi:hypothetical protein